jgi:hypothetical protein
VAGPGPSRCSRVTSMNTELSRMNRLIATGSHPRQGAPVDPARAGAAGDSIEGRDEPLRVPRRPDVLLYRVADEVGPSGALGARAPIEFAGLGGRQIDLGALHGPSIHRRDVYASQPRSAAVRRGRPRRPT